MEILWALTLLMTQIHTESKTALTSGRDECLHEDMIVYNSRWGDPDVSVTGSTGGQSLVSNGVSSAEQYSRSAQGAGLLLWHHERVLGDCHASQLSMLDLCDAGEGRVS